MPEPKTDAFILFNEKEKLVGEIVEKLAAQGISTYLWRRDIPFGETWEDRKAQKLREAHAVLVFLGSAGWGPNHLRNTEEAQRLEQRIIPILIGEPPTEAFQEAGGLFHVRRYLELKNLDAASLANLVDTIRQRQPSAHLDRIVSALVDGNEEQRSEILRQIRASEFIDRALLAARLRREILVHFGPGAENQFAATAIRDPKKISSVRSWMLSALIWADVEDSESHDLILHHVHSSAEPERNVRFWTLAGIYGARASYLRAALEVALSDSAPEVVALAQAIMSPTSPELLARFRSSLLSSDREVVWSVLRVLRIVPIPELAAAVCEQLERWDLGTTVAYDAIYALSNPVMASEATKILSVREAVERVISESRGADPGSIRNFVVLLAAFRGVDALLAEAELDPVSRGIAQSLRQRLRDLRRHDGRDAILLTTVASDTIDINFDPLGIKEDVQTLTAVLMAKEVAPPLAIGLFGDWGSGKSYFMRSMKATADELAAGAVVSPESRFCSNIVSIEFNAWHYADTNLWASLVSFIFERLAAHVMPQRSADEQQAAILLELGSAKVATGEAKSEKRRVQKLIEDGQKQLQDLEYVRQQKELELLDLRFPDLQKLLSNEEKKDINESLNNIGIPAVLDTASDLARVVSEAYTVRGRITAFFGALLNARSRALLFALIVLTLTIPLLSYLAHRYLPLDAWTITVSALMAQIVGVATGILTLLRKALDVTKSSITKLQASKKRVDDLLASKREVPTKEERALQSEIASLKAQEQEATSRLSVAAARVRELEERLLALKEGRSLARFLSERTRSEDYRRHLGLISTIRQDLESLCERLLMPLEKSDLHRVDRIILFIDDLDRCPSEKVMDVLQAVHLLLAYPLFVVVVGVDPRWLLHSLGTTYSALRNEGAGSGANPDLWRTTPQNYLEKIFQIPFNLGRMTDEGYGRLIQGLLSPAVREQVMERSRRLVVFPAEESNELDGPVPSITSQPEKPRELEEPALIVPEKAEFVVQEEALLITTWETRFAARLFELIPTPRAAKRFSNTYRILKARVRGDRLLQFEGTEFLPGEFQVPMLLLAVLIGYPSESAELFPKLHRYAASGSSAPAALWRLSFLGLDGASFNDLEERMRPIITDSGFPQARGVYLEWLPRVSRFSFELGRTLGQTPAESSLSVRQDVE
jgi:hypothetical protein